MLRSASHVSRNLRNLLKETTIEEWVEGCEWYPKAYQIAKELSGLGLDIDSICFLMASLSPRQSWDRTLYMVKEHLAGNAPKWIAAKGGDKVMAFYESIRLAGRSDEVCLDRHMASAAAGRKLSEKELSQFFGSPKRKKLVAEQVRRLAKEKKVYAAEMQAILWVTWRNRYGGRKGK